MPLQLSPLREKQLEYYHQEKYHYNFSILINMPFWECSIGICATFSYARVFTVTIAVGDLLFIGGKYVRLEDVTKDATVR